MEKKKSKEVAVLNIDFRNLPEFKGAEKKQKDLVKAYPFVKIKDVKSYELAKKNRTGLRQGRYELQKGEKAIASILKSFRGFVSEETINLIAITLDHENKQQAEVDLWEAEARKKREERSRIEKERIEGHITCIENFRVHYQAEINNATLESFEALKQLIEIFDEDVEEFQSALELVRDQLLIQANEKKVQLDEAERLRIENEKLRKERDKLSKEKADFETKKLKAKQAENKRLAKEKEAENSKKRAIAHRESLIDTYRELSKKTQKQAEKFSDEKLTEEIKRMQDLVEKKRLDALKSDKEKSLDFLQAFLEIGYTFDPIKNDSIKEILVKFIEENKALVEKYTYLIDNY